MLKLAFLVPIFPLIGSIINGFFGLKIGKKMVGYVACGSVLLSFITTVLVFIGLLMLPAESRIFEQVLFDWIPAGKFVAEFGFQIDPLSMVMMLAFAAGQYRHCGFRRQHLLLCAALGIDLDIVGSGEKIFTSGPIRALPRKWMELERIYSTAAEYFIHAKKIFAPRLS